MLYNNSDPLPCNNKFNSHLFHTKAVDQELLEHHRYNKFHLYNKFQLYKLRLSLNPKLLASLKLVFLLKLFNNHK